MNHLIVLSGPGGSGKDTVLAELLRDPELNLYLALSYTTRKPRVGERDGVDYHFISQTDFEQQIKHDQMIEYEIMDANHRYYGTSKAEMSEALNRSSVICRKMPHGALALKQHFGDQAMTIFIDATDQELTERLLERNGGLAETDIAKRLNQATQERALKPQFDLTVENHNGHLAAAVSEIKRAYHSHLAH